MTVRSLLWFDGPLAALAVAAGVSVFIAWEPHSARRATAWLCGSILAGAVVTRIGPVGGWWRRLALGACAAGAALALYVVLQFAYLGYDAKVPFLHALGMAVGSLLPRFGGWAPMSNTVATFLEGLVPLAVGVAIEPGLRPPTGVGRPHDFAATLYRWFAVASALVMVSAVALVASRGAWLALAAGFLAWAVAWGWSRRGQRQGKVVMAAGTVVAVLAAASVAQVLEPSLAYTRLSAVFDRPDRLDVYRNSLVLIQDLPFTGIGPGDQFAMALARYALLIQVPFLTYAHNLYLGLWLELGLLGMLSLTALMGAIAAAVVAGEREGLGTRFRGAWVGVAVVLVHGLSDARQLVDRWTWLPLFVLLGLMAARLARHHVRPPRLALAWPAGVAAAFLVLALPIILPLSATWAANRGMLAEIHAELGAGPAERRKQWLAEARHQYGLALTADPGQPTALRRLGLLAMDEGRFEEALADLRASWDADPGNPATRKALGLACAWTGRTPDAAELLAPVNGIFEELNTWSRYWEQEGRLTQAASATRVALALEPRNLEVRGRLADLERRVQH